MIYNQSNIRKSLQSYIWLFLSIVAIYDMSYFSF